MRDSEAAAYPFVARNELHMEQECMWAKVQGDESERRTAHVLHCFFTQPHFFTLLGAKTRFCFLLTTHEVGAARAAQLDRTHDVRLLLGAEDTKADPKRVGREGRLSPRTDRSGKGAATLRMRLGSLHLDEQRKMIR